MILWDIESGKQLKQFDGHLSAVNLFYFIFFKKNLIQQNKSRFGMLIFHPMEKLFYHVAMINLFGYGM